MKRRSKHGTTSGKEVMLAADEEEVVDVWGWGGPNVAVKLPARRR